MSTIAVRSTPRLRSTPRWIASAALGLLLAAWLLSLPGPWPRPSAAAPPDLDQLLSDPPSWRDTLVLDLRPEDAVIQRRLGFVTWSDGAGQSSATPVHILSNGRLQRVVIPLGAHPGWQGQVRDLRLTFSPRMDGQVRIVGARLFRRPPAALDALLLGAVAPLLPRFPPWPHVALVVAAGLGLGLSLVVPVGERRRRLVLLALVLGGIAGSLTTLNQLALVRELLPRYAGLSERAAAARVPAYHEANALNETLVAAADALPPGPVLAVGARVEDYLVYRARYVLAPRRVDAGGGIGAAAAGYAGLILPASQRPPPGWELAAGGEGPLAIWRVTGSAPAPTAPAGAPLGLALGLLLTLAAGWWLAGGLGWRGAARAAAAWLLGGATVALGLFALDIAGVRWSILSVGGPLLLLALLPPLAARRAGRPIWTPIRLDMPRGWDAAGWLVIALLVAAVTAQALLLPLTDQDSWRMWGLKGRAFFLDGALRPALTRYPDIDLHQPAYPPLQPLLQTFGYLVMGGLHERAIKIIFPLWYLASLLLTYSTCAAWSRRAALGWTLLLATTPLLLDHATLGNADLALAAALLLAAAALARWIESGNTLTLAGAVAGLVVAAWTKIDGLYLGGMLLVLAGALRLRAGSVSRRRTLAQGLAGLLVFAALVAPWPIYAAAIGVRLETPGLADARAGGWAGLARSLAEVGAELVFSHNNSAWGLLGGGFGALWLLCGGAVALRLRQVLRDPVALFLALAVLGGIAFYVLIMAIRPLPSIERFVLHLAPLAVLAAARAWR